MTKARILLIVRGTNTILRRTKSAVQGTMAVIRGTMTVVRRTMLIIQRKTAIISGTKTIVRRTMHNIQRTMTSVHGNLPTVVCRMTFFNSDKHAAACVANLSAGDQLGFYGRTVLS